MEKNTANILLENEAEEFLRIFSKTKCGFWPLALIERVCDKVQDIVIPSFHHYLPYIY